MDGNGGCCIARWNDGGHVAGGGGYDDMRKMDMIMLKFRPIAPKPVSQNGSSDGSAGSPPDGRHAKTALKGRRKTGPAKKTNNNNTKKRKSSSPDNDTTGVIVEQESQGEVTLLPLFPEAPDLSPTKHHQPNNVPFWLNFNNNNNNNNNNHDNYNNNNNHNYYDNYGNCNEIRYGIEENYGKCQGQGQGQGQGW